MLQSNVWWHDAFAGALNGFEFGNKKTKKKKRKLDEEAPSTALPSFEDMFKATGGARLGMRARGKQKGET